MKNILMMPKEFIEYVNHESAKNDGYDGVVALEDKMREFPGSSRSDSPDDCFAAIDACLAEHGLELHIGDNGSNTYFFAVKKRED